MVNQNSPTIKKVSSQWVRYRSVCYLVGKGLVFGTAPESPVGPASRASEVYSLLLDDRQLEGVDVVASQFSTLADRAWNYVFVGLHVEEVPEPAKLLHELEGKLRFGGHFILHTQGDPGRLVPPGVWQEKARYLRDGQFLWIGKLIRNSKSVEIKPQKPRAAKRACICRYGALGDLIMVTPLIKQLATDGFEVTLNITPYAREIVANNPYVSNILIQEKEMIPNLDLGEYWKEWEPEYDRYINLSESIEGGLLKVEGRLDFHTPSSWRRSTCDKNYYDETLRLGGYPDVKGTKGEIYLTKKELAEGKECLQDRMFNVLWAINGSSHHKMFPWLELVLPKFVEEHPRAFAYTMGDSNAAKFEPKHLKIINTAGKVPLRVALSMVAQAQCVVGPESMLTNAAGCFDTPKIVILSHSSEENLTKYFSNCTVLKPDTTMAPCYPCHQLHYSKESCPVVNIQIGDGGEPVSVPTCTAAVSPDAMLDALAAQYRRWESGV